MTNFGIVLVICDDEDNIYVFDSLCPHADKPLHQAQWDSKKAILSCRFHWAAFALKQQGLFIGGPSSPSLKVYDSDVRFENGTEVVYIKSPD